jgi:hypothetical protein
MSRKATANKTSMPPIVMEISFLRNILDPRSGLSSHLVWSFNCHVEGRSQWSSIEYNEQHYPRRFFRVCSFQMQSVQNFPIAEMSPWQSTSGFIEVNSHSAAHNGRFWVDLNPTAPITISQWVTLDPGQYSLSFWLSFWLSFRLF